MLVAAAMLSASLAAYAQSGGGYEFRLSVIAAGGGTSTNGGYTLQGTVGQYDAATPSINAGDSLQPGFWAGASGAAGNIPPPNPILFSNGFE